MKHHANPDFWARYRALSPEVQRVADRAYEHLKNDPRHPSLQLKKVGRYWSARGGARHRERYPFPVGTRVSMLHNFHIRDGMIAKEIGYEIWRRAD